MTINQWNEQSTSALVDSVIMGYVSPGSRKPKLVVDYAFIFPIDKVPGACFDTPLEVHCTLHHVCVFHGMVCVCCVCVMIP